MKRNERTGAVRVIGGDFRGRKLEVPLGGDLRPAPDRLRQAVFNIMVDFIPGARALDLFSGTGAFGFEALSRGASEAIMVELDKKHAWCIDKSIQKFGLKDKARVVIRDAFDAGDLFAGPFDIITAGPPYSVLESELEIRRLEKLVKDATGGLLAEEAAFMLQVPRSLVVSPPVGGWSDERTYGLNKALFYYS